MADVVCFGELNPVWLITVDEFPKTDSGTNLRAKQLTVGTDAPMISRMLASWGISVELICNALGKDYLGQICVDYLRASGIGGTVRLERNLETPLQFVVVDSAGTRTWFTEFRQEIRDTLLNCDISPIRDAKILYIDWYSGEAAYNAAICAKQSSVPVFLNVGDTYDSVPFTRKLMSLARYDQVSGNERDAIETSFDLAQRLRVQDDSTVLVTRGAAGAIGSNGDEQVAVPAPSVPVVDARGAGAAFSAGFIYGVLKGSMLSEATKFATAAASLKCSVLGLEPLDLSKIERLIEID